MARSSDLKEEEGRDEEIWGTWEELLLACAVSRHGPHSWDSVAMELRSRTTSAYAHLLTPDLCRNRYLHLHLRFTAGDGTDGGDRNPDGDPTAQIPWLDELRKLRVTELRQALHRSDVSIGSLQLKVKRLKEERERGLKEPGSAVAGASGSDPVKDGDGEERVGSPRSNPGGGGSGSGRSCEESNSTEKKAEKPDPDLKAVTGSGSDRAGGGEASYNGSTGGPLRSPAEEANPVNESGESVAETKENSDVQSSASLSRRRRVRRRKPAAASDAVSSPIRKPVESESQPLIGFLEMIRSTKHGPAFERRLESQESERYSSMIRRHVDLEIIQRRIGRNEYTSAEFFRDLLLLCTNATVFFPKSSPESIAAVHLRDLVTKEITAALGNSAVPSPLSAKETTPPPTQQLPPLPLKQKSDPDTDLDGATTPPPDKKAVPPPLPLVACRKRSSITAKPATKKADKDEKPIQDFILEEKEKEEKKKKVKPELIVVEKEEEEKDKKKKRESDKEEEDEVVDKKSTKQRSVVARGLRTNKTRGGGNNGGTKVAAKSQTMVPQGPKAESESEQETEMEMEMKPAGSAAKKRSAANFLNRMKRSTLSASNGPLLDNLKASTSAAAAGGRGDQKKKSREGIRKEKEKEKEKERESSAVKRTVGRPPKRATAAAPLPAKRGREEKMATPSVKKRARR